MLFKKSCVPTTKYKLILSKSTCYQTDNDKTTLYDVMITYNVVYMSPAYVPPRISIHIVCVPTFFSFRYDILHCMIRL